MNTYLDFIIHDFFSNIYCILKLIKLIYFWTFFLIEMLLHFCNTQFSFIHFFILINFIELL